MVGLSVVAAMGLFMIFVFMMMEPDKSNSFDTLMSRTLAVFSAAVCFSCVCIIVWKLAQ